MKRRSARCLMRKLLRRSRKIRRRPHPRSIPITGAFPAPSSDPTDYPAAPNFAAYLNEFAPDQSSALALAIGGAASLWSRSGRCPFQLQAVRGADKDVWQLRVAGLSRERANQICQASQRWAERATLDRSNEEHAQVETMR